MNNESVLLQQYTKPSLTSSHSHLLTATTGSQHHHLVLPSSSNFLPSRCFRPPTSHLPTVKHIATTSRRTPSSSLPRLPHQLTSIRSRAWDVPNHRRPTKAATRLGSRRAYTASRLRK
ncbi:unnamed protein product [Linum trigynum]|uniref:Uncharacterized protein n=1 Tax=Linum trigynum TaxID=586398 RepID=A0AAV2ERV5_9ROSI